MDHHSLFNCPQFDFTKNILWWWGFVILKVLKVTKLSGRKTDKTLPRSDESLKLLKLWNFLFNIKCTLTAVKMILIFFSRMTLSCCYGCGKPIIDRFSTQEFEYNFILHVQVLINRSWPHVACGMCKVDYFLSLNVCQLFYF